MSEKQEQSDEFLQLHLELKEQKYLDELESVNDKYNKIIILNKLGNLFTKIDIDKSIDYFKKAAKLGSIDDEYYCGLCYIEKSKLYKSKDPEKEQNLRKDAKDCFQAAAEKDHKKAINCLYNLIVEDGDDESEIRHFLRAKAEEGNVNSMMFIAKLLEKTSNNKSLPLKYYKMAADNCKKNEAMIYANKILETNPSEAMIYYKVSISKGSVNSCFAIAKIFKANNQLDIAIQYYKCAILILDQKSMTQKLNGRDIEKNIKAHYKIGKLYYKIYQSQLQTDPKLALQTLKNAEFYLIPIYKKSQKASQILFPIIELQKEELSKQEYMNFMNLLGLNGVGAAVHIYFKESNDINYIREAIKTNKDDAFTNYIYGVYEKDITYIQRAAELGSPEGSYDYAIHLFNQFEIEESFRYINYAYQNGVKKAASILGILYLNNWIKCDDGDNEKKAVELLESAKDEDERAALLLKEIETKEVPRRKNSLYSVFL